MPSLSPSSHLLQKSSTSDIVQNICTICTVSSCTVTNKSLAFSSLPPFLVHFAPKSPLFSLPQLSLFCHPSLCKETICHILFFTIYYVICFTLIGTFLLHSSLAHRVSSLPELGWVFVFHNSISKGDLVMKELII